jgi:hypothetical protein
MEEIRINAMFQAVQQQRDAALANVVQLAGELAVLQQKIKDLETPKKDEVAPA